MFKVIASWIEEKVHEQMVSMDSVEPRMDFRDNTIYFNSCAGLLSFHTKNHVELSRYRDNWANKFGALLDAHKNGVDVRDNFFKLYAQILSSNVKVKYKANVRTRLRLKKCTLLH